MFVSASQEPAPNIISTCIPLVTILSRGSKLTEEEAGACGLLVCPRRQNGMETTDPYGATVFNKWTPCSPATAAISTAITSKAPKIRQQHPTLVARHWLLFIVSLCKTTLPNEFIIYYYKSRHRDVEIAWSYKLVHSCLITSTSPTKKRECPPQGWAAPVQTHGRHQPSQL